MAVCRVALKAAKRRCATIYQRADTLRMALGCLFVGHVIIGGARRKLRQRAITIKFNGRPRKRAAIEWLDFGSSTSLVHTCNKCFKQTQQTERARINRTNGEFTLFFLFACAHCVCCVCLISICLQLHV